MPKFCPNCGESIPEGVKFCPECGANIESFSVNADKDQASNIIPIGTTKPVDAPFATFSAQSEHNNDDVTINQSPAIEKNQEKSNNTPSEKKAFIPRKTAIVFGVVTVIAIIAIIGVLQFTTLLSQPSDVIPQFYEHFKKGEFYQAMDLCLNPDTNLPYPKSELDQIAAALVSPDQYPNWVKSAVVEIKSSQKISENEYVISYVVKFSDTDPSGKNNDKQVPCTIKVIKYNSQWRTINTPFPPPDSRVEQTN